MDKFPHYPDNGPPIPDGVVIIRFLLDPTIIADRILVSTGTGASRVRKYDLRPVLEVPFATGAVEEENRLPGYVVVRSWDPEGEHWMIEKFNFNNILSVTRICNSVEHGRALQVWEAAHPHSDWRNWLPSAKRPPGRAVT